MEMVRLVGVFSGQSVIKSIGSDELTSDQGVLNQHGLNSYLEDIHHNLRCHDRNLAVFKELV